jgi:cytidine deaminase
MTKVQYADLFQKAKEAAERAYCPYSKFRVGATVIDSAGYVYAGCNVENASYGLTICAERSAIFAAVAAGATKIAAVLIWTPTEVCTMPCGACRQVIREFGPDAEIVSACGESPEGSGRITRTTREMLPNSFGPEDLLGDEVTS